MAEASPELVAALKAQEQHAQASHRLSRAGWTPEQWVADAERLLNDPDGSVLDLVNGHAIYMLAELRRLRGEPVIGRYEYGVDYIRKSRRGPEPHRAGMTRAQAEQWLYDPADGVDLRGAFTMVRRLLGSWEVVSGG